MTDRKRCGAGALRFLRRACPRRCRIKPSASQLTKRTPNVNGRERDGRPPSVDEEGEEELPPVQAVLTELRDGDALDEFVACMTCAEGRGITEADLAPWATFGGAGDLARQAAAHDTTMTF
ncbi:MAG: hypothetical protein BRD38_04410 [Bacteroidetes bacterium QH_9_67_14]|nr:MAG: hypothetical protein BRD38_04410 [Bacteroidetes bacterium QH_9_67_14]